MAVSPGTTASEREGEQDARGLHLPDLLIQGFRGIEELAIPRLGRVTLLAGRNGAGKTTVLEAVRVYAARGSYPALSEVLNAREEVFSASDEDGDLVTELDWEALFFGRAITEGQGIVIGPRENAAEQIRIDPAALGQEQADRLSRILPGPPLDARVSALQISFRRNRQRIPYIIVGKTPGLSTTQRDRYLSRDIRRLLLQGSDPWPVLGCKFLGPELLSNATLSEYWGEVALTDDEERAVQALRLIRGDVTRVAMVGDDARASRGRMRISVNRSSGRRVIVRVSEHDAPVPLRSLGDGARRLFGVALALANSRGGFLLIDEAENGIHHSVQKNFWRMVMEAAEANDVQVLATTHSWDCVRGFSQAANELDTEGRLVRIERDGGKAKAIEYSEEGLSVIAEQGIEVR